MVEKNPRQFCGDTRAQTLQDYVLGVSLFLGIVFLVVGFTIPSVIAPFGSDVSSEELNQADRVSGKIVENASLDQAPNELNVTTVERIVVLSPTELRTRYNLPTTTSLNISVRASDTDAVVVADDGTRLGTSRALNSDDAVTSKRIVTLSDGSCSPACRLVVGVW